MHLLDKMEQVGNADGMRFSRTHSMEEEQIRSFIRTFSHHYYICKNKNHDVLIDTGKTTLMNAINNGKLEGWPTDLRTMYVDSGSNVDPVHEAKNVMTELLTSTNKSEGECKAILTTLKFTPTMIEGTIGELSGGWQMKLRLATAVLVDADILLLDEPTNHLDVKTVNWLIDYLSNLTKTTVIIVSHDTQFIETVCTDVIHYENRVK